MEQSDKIRCLIPARGGSKGVPRKNITSIAGKPLIAWSIEAALSASAIENVYISTEDAEIAEVARAYDALIIDRPPELALDETSSDAVLIDAVRQWEAQEGVYPEFFVFIQCTSPIIDPRDIDNAIDYFRRTEADSLISVVAEHLFLWRRTPDAAVVPVNHEKSYRLRRQEREPDYRESGSIYIVRSEKLLQDETRYCGKTVMYEVPRESAFEFDHPEDIELLEPLLSWRKENGRQSHE